MIKIRDFRVLEKIGSGSFSQVYKVQKDDDMNIYALKRIKILKLKEKDRENTLNEIRLLASLSDENIVSYKEAFIEETSNSLCIVMEFADNFDLMMLVRKKKDSMQYIREEDIWRIFIQILNGLFTLHQHDIVHRDLKCANIFMFSDGRVKIGDLNISKVAKLGFLTTQTGTPYYTRPPFIAENFKELKANVLIGIFPPIPKFYSEELFFIIRKLLEQEPSKRPSCSELLKHPIIVRRSKMFSRKFSKPQEQRNEAVRSQLMKTIKMKDFEALKESLPPSQYMSHKSLHERADSSKKVYSTITPEMVFNRREESRESLQKAGQFQTSQAHQPNRMLRHQSFRNNTNDNQNSGMVKMMQRERPYLQNNAKMMSVKLMPMKNADDNIRFIYSQVQKKNPLDVAKQTPQNAIKHNQRRLIRDSTENSGSKFSNKIRFNISYDQSQALKPAQEFRNHYSMDAGSQQHKQSVSSISRPKVELKFRGEALLAKKKTTFGIKKSNPVNIDSLEDLLQLKQHSQTEQEKKSEGVDPTHIITKPLNEDKARAKPVIEKTLIHTKAQDIDLQVGSSSNSNINFTGVQNLLSYKYATKQTFKKSFLFF